MHPHIDIGNKSVLIIGWPASGKSYVATRLAKDNPNHKLIRTDDYIKYGFVQALYVLLADIQKCKHPTIVEGIQGARLLRKGVETNTYYPDIVIELEITPELMYATYAKERIGKDTSTLRGFVNSYSTILAAYKAMPNKKPPQWIKLKNQY